MTYQHGPLEIYQNTQEPRPADDAYMTEALAEARLAEEQGEVPVGALRRVGLPRGGRGPVRRVLPGALRDGRERVLYSPPAVD